MGTRRNHKAQKLTREAGGKIVSPTFRLPHCYRGETTKKACNSHRLDHRGTGVKVTSIYAIYVTITHTVSTTRALVSRLMLHKSSIKKSAITQPLRGLKLNVYPPR